MISSKISIGSVAKPHSGGHAKYIISRAPDEVNPLTGKKSAQRFSACGNRGMNTLDCYADGFRPRADAFATTGRECSAFSRDTKGGNAEHFRGGCVNMSAEVVDADH